MEAEEVSHAKSVSHSNGTTPNDASSLRLHMNAPHENLCDLSSKLKTDPTEIYQDACNLPSSWNPETPKI
ncbi:hypothetical protein ACTXT7_015757 [Hymenolepis weldensis]